MRTTLAEAFRDVVSLNPNAKASTISTVIISYMESAIAEAILSIDLPPPPSPRTSAIERFRLRRYRASRRRTVDERQELIAELYSLKHSLNGNAYADRTENVMKWNGTVQPNPPQLSGHAYLSSLGTFDVPPLETLWGASHTYVRPPQKVGPYLDVSSQPVEPFRLSYNESFADNFSNPLYETISRAIEDSLRDFADRTSLSWRLEMSSETDVELPAWRRFVLRIHVNAKAFEDKLKLWDGLDRAIRQRLTDLARENPTSAAEIMEFDKLLYLRMDMA